MDRFNIFPKGLGLESKFKDYPSKGKPSELSIKMRLVLVFQAPDITSRFEGGDF